MINCCQPLLSISLKLKYDQLLSTFAFNFNLRRYNVGFALTA